MDIAIIGGGLGGLTLARVLRVKGLEATVYDLDASADERPQGGQLDLGEDHGQYALGVADLTAEFQERIHSGADAIKVYDRSGACLLDDAAGDEETLHPEIDRLELRRMLVESLDPRAIRWGKKAASIDTSGPRPAVGFVDGSEIAADLVVGADGAWSVVRTALTATRPVYSGVSFVELRLEEVAERHPGPADTVGGGTMVAMDGGKGVIAQRNGDGSIRVYVSFKEDERWFAELADSGRAAIEAELLGRFVGWAEPLMRLVTDADGGVICRPIHALPVDHSWERRPGVTLIGDAAHVMSPFGGHGANLAMFDAARLGELLAAGPDAPEQALTRYEAELFPRSEEHAAQTVANLEMFHGPEAPRRIVELFTGLRNLPA